MSNKKENFSEDKIADTIFKGCEERNPTFHKWVMKVTENYLKSNNQDPMDLWEIITNEFSENFFKDDDSIRDWFEKSNKEDDKLALMLSLDSSQCEFLSDQVFLDAVETCYSILRWIPEAESFQGVRIQ